MANESWTNLKSEENTNMKQITLKSKSMINVKNSLQSKNRVGSHRRQKAQNVDKKKLLSESHAK